ncbi:hypothetical protein IWZ00DRAFT_544161 [Phyllosticta capitalensis]
MASPVQCHLAMSPAISSAITPLLILQTYPYAVAATRNHERVRTPSMPLHRPKTTFILCVYLLILASVPLAQCYPLLLPQSSYPQSLHSAPASLYTTATKNTTKEQGVKRCPRSTGNGDLYGLGIRLGIYLQWLSSHITHTVSPASAAATHDANSVFLLAILIALTTGTARPRKWIRAEEAYVVLLIAWGFVGTVVGVAGVRLRGLEGHGGGLGARKWVRGRVDAWSCKSKDKAEDGDEEAKVVDNDDTTWWSWAQKPLSRMRRWTLMTDPSAPTPPRHKRKRAARLTLSAASVIKHPSLSWSGILWRSSILSYLAGLNAVAIALVSAVVLVFIVQVLLLAARGKFRAWWAKIAVGKNTHPTGQDGQKTANRQNTLSPEIETAARPKGKQPASGSNKISSPPKRKRTNTSTSSGHRRSNSWPVAVAAASASAMGKPIQPIIFGVRDVIAQWFVRKEAEQQKEIEEHKYDKQRKQKRRTKQRSQPPPPENPESVENAELDVVWKPFMALMMNHGEERQGDAGGHVEMRRLQRHDGQTAAHRRSRDGGGGVDRPKAPPPPPPPKHNHIHAANTDTAPPHPHPTIRLTTHILTLLSIGLFIVSIEATLSLASLSSINDISSIGQLIPFIIGLASFAASLRVLAIEMYRRRNPDWRDWAWEAALVKNHIVIDA